MLSCGTAVLIALSSSPAWAFVCARALDASGRETGPALSWTTRSYTYTQHIRGTTDLPNENEFDVIDASFVEWEGTTACSSSASTDISFTQQPRSTTDVVGFDFLTQDNENLMIFRDNGWPHVGQTGVVIALTTTTFSVQTGEIIDADIEYNSADFFLKSDLTTCTPGSPGAGPDLLNTAVHEVGHFLGLAHSPVAESTMDASSTSCEIDKRDLACDDRDAIVFKYPAGQGNGYCAAGSVNSACGFCAPFTLATSAPRVRTGDPVDGMDGGCNHTGTFSLLPSAAGWMLLMALRRRRSSLTKR